MDSLPLDPENALLDFASETPTVLTHDVAPPVVHLTPFNEVSRSIVTCHAPRRPTSGRAWVVATVVACIGALAGFAAGSAIAPTIIVVSGVASVRAEAPVHPVAARRAEQLTVAQTPAVLPAVVPAVLPAVPTSGETPPIALTADHRGAIEVLSRPRGAQVFLNGNVVGRAPLSIVDLPEGTHEVRLELSGFSPKVTSVRVATGSRVRVRASLEP